MLPIWAISLVYAQASWNGNAKGALNLVTTFTCKNNADWTLCLMEKIMLDFVLFHAHSDSDSFQQSSHMRRNRQKAPS